MSDKAGNVGVRRRSREMALQLLFQSEFVDSSGGEMSAEQVLKRFSSDFSFEKDVAEYGSLLFLGVSKSMKEIDALIQSSSAHWKTSRMGLVDLSVMRIAVFEMKFMRPEIPPSVAINEAVEIAKIFGSTESGAFVNGILDQVSRA